MYFSYDKRGGVKKKALLIESLAGAREVAGASAPGLDEPLLLK